MNLHVALRFSADNEIPVGILSEVGPSDCVAVESSEFLSTSCSSAYSLCL